MNTKQQTIRQRKLLLLLRQLRGQAARQQAMAAATIAMGAARMGAIQATPGAGPFARHLALVTAMVETAQVVAAIASRMATVTPGMTKARQVAIARARAHHHRKPGKINSIPLFFCYTVTNNKKKKGNPHHNCHIICDSNIKKPRICHNPVTTQSQKKCDSVVTGLAWGKWLSQNK